jgi:hypothetical protein
MNGDCRFATGKSAIENRKFLKEVEKHANFSGNGERAA